LKRVGGGRVGKCISKWYITTECMWKLDCLNLYCQRLCVLESIIINHIVGWRPIYTRNQQWILTWKYIYQSKTFPPTSKIR
jgi:hypothetical protein